MTTSDDPVRLSQDGGQPASGAPRPSVLTAFDLTKQYFINRDPSAAAPRNHIHTRVTLDILAAIDPANPPKPDQLESILLTATNSIITIENTKIPKNEPKYPFERELTNWQVAKVLLHLHHIIRIAPSTGSYDREYDLLAMYNDSGPNLGIYTTSEDDIRTTARKYNTQLNLKGFKEMIAILREDAPRRHVCRDRDVVAVNNGVFFYGLTDQNVILDNGAVVPFQAKSLHPFDPELVFLSKSRVNYVKDAPEQFITHPTDGTTWEIREWINDLSDDEGIPELLWEIIGAIIRPNVRWGKTAWFYSEKGNNGKGTLCSLMRNLVGHGSHASIPLSALGKDFALEPLTKVNAIIVDENDVGTFIDKAANLKTIVTNDVIQIDRKYRMPIAFQFFGLMVQCLNEFPRMKDKSESNYRRQLFVPFAKSFTGHERRYIKNDYLQRREVLEYALWYVLHQAGSSTPGSYYEFSEPLVTQIVLAEYKENNDPVRAFWQEMREQLAWDLAPFTFLYDLYRAWFAAYSPSGSPVSRPQFVRDLVAIIDTDTMWHCPDKNRKIRPGQMMNEPELLIARYELKDWLNTVYKGSDPVRRSELTNIQANYRGLLRMQTPNAGSTDDDSESDVETQETI